MPVLYEPAGHPTSDLQCGTVEERLAIVERVAYSAAFSKSVRLRDFLRYVGLRAAKPGAPEIHEQEIGEKVFGRRRDYDRSQDNIVRVNATELRRRIDTYFATEGIDDPIVFSIPRGSYMPIFRQNPGPAELPKPAPPSVIIADAPVPKQRSTAIIRIGAAALVLLSLACGFLLWQNARLRKVSDLPEKRPTVDAFWSDMIDGPRDTDIVMPDDSISMEEEMTGTRIPFYDYTERDFLRHVNINDLSPDRAADLHITLGHNLVTLGGVYAALHIHDLRVHSTTMHLAWARFYSADSMKQDNVVLIGGAKANPWVGLFEDQLNFKFDYSSPNHDLVFRNRHPQPGEPSSIPTDASSYSVVAFLPNPSNKGSVVLLLGSDSDASNAAAEYLTSEESMSQLLQIFHRKTFPHFELLLKVSRIRGTSLAAKMIAYRIYP